MSLIGFRYVQASDPGSVGAGYQWYNTSSGIVYERNITNTGWVSIGNANIEAYGALLRTGGVMSAPITGVSGWAPETSPDFNTSAKLEGVNLATTNDLSTLQTTLEDYVDQQVASALASQGVVSTITSDTAIQTGTLIGATATTSVTIPLPTFPDGQQATPAQCKWIVAPYKGKTGDTADAFYIYYRDSTDSNDVDPSSVLTFCAYTAKSDRSLKSALGIVYFILARR